MLDAGDADTGGLACGVQLSLPGGFLEELVGRVAEGFGVGEKGGEGGPGGVREDAVGVVGHGRSSVVGEDLTARLPRAACFQLGEHRGGGLVGGGLEVL